MPHVSIKLYPGRTEEQKQQLTEQIVQDLMKFLNSKEASISVAFEEVSPADWPEQVYRPEILQKPETLYRKPGYNPFE
jgi:4-oxalocrotonate tautomerase